MLEASINYGGGGYVGIAEVLHSCLKARENFNEIEDSWSFFSFCFPSFFLNNINDFLSLSPLSAYVSSHLISSSIHPYCIHFSPLQLSLFSLSAHFRKYLIRVIIYPSSLASDLTC